MSLADDELPVFDKAAMLSNIDDDAALLAEVVAVFLDDLPEQQAALRQARAAGDFAGQRAAAHKLKGSLASLMGKRAEAAARALEQACKEGDGSRLPELHAALAAELEALARVLREEVR